MKSGPVHRLQAKTTGGEEETTTTIPEYELESSTITSDISLNYPEQESTATDQRPTSTKAAADVQVFSLPLLQQKFRETFIFFSFARIPMFSPKFERVVDITLASVCYPHLTHPLFR